MNWKMFALKVPALIGGLMSIVEKVKGRGTGKDKHDAVVDAIPDAIELVEFGAGRDLLNDAAIITLRDEYIKAQAVVINARRQAAQIIAEAEGIASRAREALESGILTKSPTE